MKKVAYILGTSGSLETTPWDIESADYLACWPVTTQPCAQGKRFDAVFEIHDEKIWQNYKPQIKQFIKKNPDTDFFMQREYKEIPKAKEFPLREIQDTVDSVYMKRYFTSTIAFMMAYAIWKGYETINLFGVAMGADEEEYSMQRSCMESWIGYAVGKGCNITIAQPAMIMSCNYMYGYEGDKDIAIKLSQTKEGVMMGMRDLEQKVQDAKSELEQQRGAANMIDILMNKVFKGL